VVNQRRMPETRHVQHRMFADTRVGPPLLNRGLTDSFALRHERNRQGAAPLFCESASRHLVSVRNHKNRKVLR